nr:MAG TPA: hypothetical protein [Caudoviricetes sp.]
MILYLGIKSFPKMFYNYSWKRPLNYKRFFYFIGKFNCSFRIKFISNGRNNGQED